MRIIRIIERLLSMGFTGGFYFRKVANSIFNILSFCFFFLSFSFVLVYFYISWFFFFLSLLFLPLCFFHVLVTHFALDNAQACQKSLLLKFLALFILSTLLCSILMPFRDGLPACILDHYVCLFIEQIFISFLFMTKDFY